MAALKKELFLLRKPCNIKKITLRKNKHAGRLAKHIAEQLKALKPSYHL
jgi:hypothetical protein